MKFNLILIVVFAILSFTSCNSGENKDGVKSERHQETKEENTYQLFLKSKRVKTKQVIAVPYKFGEPSTDSILIYKTHYTENGYIKDSIIYKENKVLATESYTYNKQDKLIKRELFDEANVLISKLERVFNKNGDEKSFKSFSLDTLRYSQQKAYDEENNLTKITDYYNDGSVRSISAFDYNSKGDIVSRKEMNNLGKVVAKQTIGYDSEGRKVKEAEYDSTGNVISKTLIKNYDSNDKIQLIEKYNRNDSMVARYEFEYNEEGKETKNTIYNGINQVLRQSLTTYDAKGNRISFKIYEGSVGLLGYDETKYNEEGLEIETKVFNGKNVLDNRKVKEYNQKQLLVKEINYNKLNEPEFEFRYEYSYFSKK